LALAPENLPAEAIEQIAEDTRNAKAEQPHLR
jgi:hypothetical protein